MKIDENVKRDLTDLSFALCSLSVTLSQCGRIVPSSFPPLRVVAWLQEIDLSVLFIQIELSTPCVEGGTGESLGVKFASILPNWLF